MVKILKKESVSLDELKELISEGCRIILIGEFSEDEKQLYNSLGIYDLAKDENEAKWLENEPTSFDKIEIDNSDKTEVKTTIKEVEVQKPGVNKKYIKGTVAIIAVLLICCMSLYGFSTQTLTGAKLYNGIAEKLKESTRNDEGKSVFDFLKPVDVVALEEKKQSSGGSWFGGSNNKKDEYIVPEHSYQEIGNIILGEELEVNNQTLTGTWISILTEIPEDYKIEVSDDNILSKEMNDIILTLNKDNKGSFVQKDKILNETVWEYKDGILTVGESVYTDIKTDGRFLKITDEKGVIHTLFKTTKVEKDSRLVKTWEQKDFLTDKQYCRILDDAYNFCAKSLDLNMFEKNRWKYTLNATFKEENKIDLSTRHTHGDNLSYEIYDYGFMVVNDGTSVEVYKYYFEDDKITIIENCREYVVIHRCELGTTYTTVGSLEEAEKLSGITVNKDLVIDGNEYTVMFEKCEIPYIIIKNEEQTQYITIDGDVVKFLPNNRYVEGEHYNNIEDNGVKYFDFLNELPSVLVEDMFSPDYVLKVVYTKPYAYSVNFEMRYQDGYFYNGEIEENYIRFVEENDITVKLDVAIGSNICKEAYFSKENLPVLENDDIQFKTFGYGGDYTYSNHELKIEFVPADELTTSTPAFYTYVY